MGVIMNLSGCHVRLCAAMSGGRGTVALCFGA